LCHASSWWTMASAPGPSWLMARIVHFWPGFAQRPSLCSCLTWIRNRSSVSELPRCRSSVMVQSHRSPLSLALAEYYRILRFLLLLKSSLAEAWTRGTRENGCLHHFAAGLVAVPVAALGSSLCSWLMALPLQCQCIVIPWLASGLSIQEWLSSTYARYDKMPSSACSLPT